MDVLEVIVRLVGIIEIFYFIEIGLGISILLLFYFSKDYKVFFYDCGSNGLIVVCFFELLNVVNVEFIEGFI